MASVHETNGEKHESSKDRQKNADLLVHALRPRYIYEMRYGNGRVIKESSVMRLSAAYKYCSLLENTIKSICLEHEVPVPNQCQLLTGDDQVEVESDHGRQSRKRKNKEEHHVPSAHSSPIDVTETPTTSSGGSSGRGGGGNLGDGGGEDTTNQVTFATPVVLETPINNTLSELSIKKRRLDMDINNNEVSSVESFQCGSYSLRLRSRVNPTSSTPAYSPLLKPKKKTPTKSTATNNTESPVQDADLHVPPNSASSSLALIKHEPSKLIASMSLGDNDALSKQVMDAMTKDLNTNILENILNDDLNDSQRNV